MNKLNLEKILDLPNKEKIVSPENNNEKNVENIVEHKKEIISEIEANVRKQAEVKIKNDVGQDNLGQRNLKEEKIRQIKEIDSILSEGLEDIFLDMPMERQQIFKKTGEEVTTKINELMGKTKIKFEKIVNLIKKWLGLIPNVSNYYLIQEAKIKADKIIKTKENKYK
jgi:hypothetical protein